MIEELSLLSLSPLKPLRRCFCNVLSLSFDLDILFHVVAYLGEILLHALGILVVNDVEQFFQLCAYLCHRVVGVGVEQNLLQQEIVLVEHALGYLHVALEGGAWRVLVLHDSRKGEGADERDAQRVGHGAVVLLERVLVDV